MNLKKSRLLSLATSLLVMASSVVGISAANAAPASVPVTVTFESDDSSGYALGDSGTAGIDFGGNASSVVTSTVGSNTSKVGKIVNGDVCYSGTTFLKLPKGTQLISSSSYVATMDLYSTTALDKVKLKLEGVAGDPAREVDVTHAGNGWQTLSFDFGTGAAVAPGNYRIASLFIGFSCDGPHPTTGQSFYFDNASFPGATYEAVVTPPTVTDVPSLFNFEGDGTTGYVDPFGGETASIETDAPAGGSAGSTKALKITDNGWAPWSGVTYGWHDTTLISATNSTATANIYAPVSGLPIVLKVENGPSNGAVYSESAAVTSVAGWHKYTFTFTGFDTAVVYGKTAIFVNFGATARTGDVWYVDDVAFAGATSALLAGADTPSLFNFEGDGTTGYVDPFGGETASIATDAPAGGSAGSTKALKITDNGWAPWSGVTYGWHDTTLISATNSTATANIYAPAAGLPIVLKVENGANPDLNKESAAVMSVEGWNRYTFTFTGYDTSVVYGKTAIFVNFGSAARTGAVWYVDDIAFAGATTPALVVPEVLVSKVFTFEGDGSTGYTDPFGGPTVSIGVEAPAGGSMGSTKVMKYIDNAWADWGGVTFGWVDASLLSRTKHVATANIYAPVAGQTIKLKLEDGGNPDINTVVDVTSVQGWNTYSFDFTAYDPAFKYNKASIFVNFGAVGAGRSGQAWYIDEVAFNGAASAALGAPASGPATPYNVRLADWNATNSFDGTHVWGDGGLGSWFPANTGYFAHYVGAGSTFTLRYSVTNATTGAAAPNGTVVKLRLGAGYSGSNARFTVGGVVVNGLLPHNGEMDIASKSLVVSGGFVTVQVTSNDSDEDATDNPFSATRNPDGLNQLFMQVKPEVDGNATTNGDWVNIITTKQAATPTITSVSATSGKKGQAIDIVGTNLGDALGTSVVLYTAATSKAAAISTPVTVLSVNASGTRMTIAAPAVSQKGYLKITTGGGTASASTLFSSSTTNTSKPTITLTASLVKEVGSTFTLNGTNIASATSIKIGQISAPFSILSANSVVVTVPAGAVSGSTISATNLGGTVTSTKFVYQAAVVASRTAAARVGQTVTITGSNLKATSVIFGGNKSAKPVINNGETLTVVVPTGALTGAIKITTGAGVVYTESFTVTPPAPTVTSFTPSTGKKGVTIVTVKGTNLTGATVTVGSAAVTLSAGANSTSFKFVIPAGAVTGKINVTTAGGTVSSSNNLTVN